ncbi:MAG: nodulation protein NfeD [Candidatus Dadabacteria bacterium]|nr:MAG: nodulation protein NfeD [Candidatus Dadabacteria bacterium]
MSVTGRIGLPEAGRPPRRRWPILASLLLTACLVAAAVQTPGASRVVWRIRVDGPINPAVADFISTSIERASASGASMLVVELDTPGGLLNSTKTIVKDILGAPIPVAVYVAPAGAGATSAGVFITLAAHVAAMAPGTTIGAAHPVSGQGGDIKGDMRKKVENYAVSFVESIAGQRGRNVEWAEKAVRESVSVTAREAVELGVVDFLASDLKELLVKANGRKVEVEGRETVIDLGSLPEAMPVVVDVEMSFRQKVLNVITDPNIAYLLMMAGMLGLYVEFTHPGAVFPGVVGTICLLLALLAVQVLPINLTGVLLILLGMAFLVAELFMPSFGVLGFGGIVALTLGSLFLYTPESQLMVDRSLIVATAIVFGAILLFVVTVLVRDRRRRSVTGAEGLVGEIGVTVTPVHASGKIRVHGEIWNARSEEPIDKDRRVRVESVEGLLVRVREIEG